MTNFRINPDKPFNNIVTNISSGFNSYVETDPQSINTLATLNYGNKILHDKDTLSGSAREFAYPTVRPHISSSLQNKRLLEIPNRSISTYSPTLNQSRNVRIALAPDAIRQNKFDFSSNAFDFGYPTVKNYGWCGEKLSTVWSNSGGRVGAFAFYSKGADTTGMNLGINHQQPPLQYPYNTRSSFVVGNNNAPNCFCNVINLSGTYVFDWTLEYGLRLKSSSNTFVDTGDMTLQSGPDYFDIKLYSNVNASYIWIRFRPPVRWRYYYNDWTFNEDFSILENSTTEFVRVVNCCGDDAEAPPIPSPGSSLTPTFGSTTATANGFTVQITNYNSSYTWAGTATASGTVAISGTGLVTVTGVAAYTSSTVTITASRAGYAVGAASVTATSLGDYTFTTSSGAITITGYIGAGGAVTIPATIGGLPVVAIGISAFYGRTGLTSVSIPSSVTSIGDGAFYGCTGLTSVSIPSSVTSIGDNAFFNCTGLTSVSIPSSVTSIGFSAFQSCTGLTSVTISNGVTSIGGGAFRGCIGLSSVSIPSSVTSIGTLAFYNCTGLSSVSIPSSVTSLGQSAFQNCSSLTSVVIPSGVTSIGNYVFSGCTGLTSVSIPSSVTSIGVQAFYGCTGLTSVSIPSSVTSIGDNAFEGCSGLTSVWIPSSVTSIGIGVFYGCSGLTSVSIPSSVTSISVQAFSYCTGLISVTIPGSVTSIGMGAFIGCTGLTSVTIPSSVTSIEDNTVFEGSGLTTVTIANGQLSGITSPTANPPGVAFFGRTVATQLPA